MAKLLSAYFGRTIRVSDVPAQMRAVDLSYPELFWTNTPYYRPEVYEALDGLNRVDYSPTYYFRVRQAMRLLSVYRESPKAYAELASAYQGRFGWTVLPSAQWSFVSEPLSGALPAAPASGVLHQDISERFVLLPEIASGFGVRPVTTEMSAERSTIGSALFVAHHLRRLQGDRYSGFQITRMLAHGDESEENESFPLHTMGWAFDVRSSGLTKTDQRDLKFILTDLRQAGLLAYVEHASDPTFHVVRHPDHAAQFEQFYWDAMAGNIPVDQPRLASASPVAAVLAETSRSFGDGPSQDRMPRVLIAIGNFFGRMYSFFSRP
jgi:hypothetical protein